LGRYGISKIVQTPGPYGRFGNGFIAFHQYFGHKTLPLSTNYSASSVSVIEMATSGHILQQIAHLTQSSGRAWYAGKYPFALTFLLISSTFFGQTLTHRLQPLHASVSMQ
jgi:hypothetical protein